MKKYKFSNAQRFAIYVTHREKCYLCTKPIDLKTMEVDHIIPESLLSDEEKLKKALNAFDLKKDFDINSYENWLPSCGPCNRKKLSDVFEPTPIIQLMLKQARKKSEVVKKLVDKTESNQRIMKALTLLKKADEEGVLDEEVKREMIPLIQFQFNERSEEIKNESIKLTPEYEVASANIIDNLINDCHERVLRGYIDEAKVLIEQIESMMSEIHLEEIISRFTLLKAQYLVKADEIEEAKDLLLNGICNFKEAKDLKLEYLELCERSPDYNCDEAEAIWSEYGEQEVQCKLIQFDRLYQSGKVPDVDIEQEVQVTDPWLRGRLLCQKSLFLDLEKKVIERDAIVDSWESVLPKSPRPNLFRVIYKSNDALRNPGDVSALKDAINFVENERLLTQNKDPLLQRDKLSWKLHELALMFEMYRLSASDLDLASIRDETFSLVLECYFDKRIYSVLKTLMTKVLPTPDQFSGILSSILNSKVSPPEGLIDAIFLRAIHDAYIDEKFLQIINDYKYETLSEIIASVAARDFNILANLLNEKADPIFSIAVIDSFSDADDRLCVLDNIHIPDEYESDFILCKIRSLVENDSDVEALDLVSKLEIKNAAPIALNRLLRLAYDNSKWDLFIRLALHVLSYEIDPIYKIDLSVQLAIAYFEQGDDSNAIYYAKYALDDVRQASIENSRYMLHVLGQAYMNKGEIDKAIDAHEKYSGLDRSFPLAIEQADIYIKTNRQDRYEEALSIIIEAYEKEESYDDTLFVSAYLQLNELVNLGCIILSNEVEIKDDLFVKFEGIKNKWFYIGEKTGAIGAVPIEPGSDNYQAVINKSLSEQIEWPADRFSGNDAFHSIVHILKKESYLYARSREAMENIADLGNAPIYRINILDDEGELNLENINKFFEEEQSSKADFFESYRKTPMPFSVLSKMEGGLPKAMAKITSEALGFIRFNDSTILDIENQSKYAAEALKDKPCVIDGLSAVTLTEAGLLETIGSHLHKLYVPTSVIRLLRDIAKQVNDTSEHRAGFVKGKFQYIPVDLDQNKIYRKKFLDAAEYLNSLPGKVVGKSYVNSGDKKSLDDIIPNYFSDSFRLAQDLGAYILSDDGPLSRTYAATGESVLPNTTSSLSVVRCLVDEKIIHWEEYLKYFSLLSFYRYHLLPINVDDLMQSVFVPSNEGLITYDPNNILHFNLKLTLSPEYGVNDEVFASIISLFFSRVILDNSIPPDVAEEVFKLTVLESIEGRNKRVMSAAILQLCENYVEKNILVGSYTQSKLQLLKKQLFLFLKEFSPILT